MSNNLSSFYKLCKNESRICDAVGDVHEKLTSPVIFFSYGMLLTIIGIIGIIGNGLVLFVFTRFRRLKGPFSTFVLNLAIADFSTSILHFMPAVSSFKHEWIFKDTGCTIYAFGVGQFGLVSIVTLSTIAVERYLVITAKPVSGSWKLTRQGATKVCVFVWIYCLSITLPPVFGWSKYVLEGFETSCSWDYTTKTLSNRSFYIYMLVLGFVLPVSIITYCYVFIVMSILDHNKEMADCNSNIRSVGSESWDYRLSLNVARRGQAVPIRSALRTSYIILILIGLFMISWTPYAVVTFVGQFGDEKTKIEPWISALPALCAKASVVYNPIVYGLSHPHFRSSVRQYLSGCTTVGNSHTELCTPGRNNRLVTNKCLNRFALLTEQNKNKTNVIELKCVRHRRAQQNSNSICMDYYSEPDCRSLTLTMEPNRDSAIIKIDKVPFKVVMSTIRSKSISAKINSIVDKSANPEESSENQNEEMKKNSISDQFVFEL
ncbi:G protein-coupled receptor, rhodopsin-like,GPCR, rhodopsin-like, 7TM [Cinara cedri]|uniref:G protein-coupled receptor, rhodopsin-like,GPCR, rhodopsin-like, 7TM n=1 Tax=Cinara cedri TaxID=506608 RepID=A0A5E4MMG1_9HEMI|nr:G protein-coupled receptor, rhodopsin-like,GPCR, rhodopsin-like, 7TM [Cinara cedri]